MLKEIENNNLPDMAIPNNLLESGKKSFTLPVPSGTDADSSAKGIEVKFYPHPGKKHELFCGAMVPGHHIHIPYASILRQTSAFYVKKVVNASFLQQLGLESTKEGGVNLKLKFGIKKACLISMICDSTTDVMLKRKSSPVTAGTQVDECTTSSRLGQEAGHLRGHSSFFWGASTSICIKRLECLVLQNLKFLARC